MRFGCKTLPLLLALLFCAAAMAQQLTARKNNSTLSPADFPYFTFDELVTLSKDQPLSPALDAKLSTVLHSLVLDNSIAPAKASYQRIPLKKAGPAMRLAEWNIERGENFDWVLRALQDETSFRAALVKEKPSISAKVLKKAADEAAILQQSDVIVLNEVDLGMTRSQYHAVARELATALKLNYVYGVEFVEVDPLKLGTEQFTDEDTGGDDALKEDLNSSLKPDPARYKGLHGSAILSRYPITNAHMERLPVCHDWFNDEIKSVATVEQGKRIASDKIFLEKIEREIRRGGRMAIIADLKVPDVPGGTLTVVEAHLENKCKPACRRQQMDALLESVQQISNPVVLAGDMNTTGGDASDLSVGYIIKSKVTDYRFWAKQAVMWGTPIPSFSLLNYFKNYTDPTAPDIKVFANNKEAALFNDVKKFKFADGGQFDFRGDRSRTVNHTRKKLANSNQRARKGFVYTFSLPRDFKGLAGRFKLDSFFIKPVDVDQKRTEQLAPWYPRTMVDLNNAPQERISDHSPITVDLPLTAKK